MRLSRQSLSSIAELLGTISWDSAALLLYKHLGLRLENVQSGALGRLEMLEAADPEAVWELVSEIVRESAAIRISASPKYAYDGRLREVQRWLAHDGWAVENGLLLRVAPGAEEATGIRDALLGTLDGSEIDRDGAIRGRIRDAASAFVREPPDLNASITNVRIALETIARRAAAARAGRRGGEGSIDAWGSALAYLRNSAVLTLDEEQVLAKVYTFISPAAHSPAGITEEEWARLARTFGLSACYFIVKRHDAVP
jgi:hypothetical protein